MEKTNKKNLKSRLVVGALGVVTVLSLGANVAMMAPNADSTVHAATEYVADNYFRAHYVGVDPVSSSETIAYPNRQQALSDSVSTSIRRNGTNLIMRDSNHQIYNFYASINTGFSGDFKVQNGDLVGVGGQVIKLQPVNISEVKDFAHPGKVDAPVNTLVLTQSDYNYIKQLDGLKVQID